MRDRGTAKLKFKLAILFFWSIFRASFAEANSTPDVQVGVENQFYRTVLDPSWFPLLDLSGKYFSASDGTEWNVDLDARIGLRNPKANGFTSQNAYYGDQDQSSSSLLKFSFGRRNVTWNTLDEMWGLGNIQPLDAWDRLRPRSQGLTGVFAYAESPHFTYRAFASYLALPETGPNVVLDHNQFQNVDPQSIISTPQTITILNHATPLGYNLDIQPLNQILFRPSFTLMMETKPNVPLFGRILYGYLPLSYFPLALQASLSTPLDQVVVDIHPRLVQHHIYGADLSYDITPQVKVGLSELIDEPTAESYPDDYTFTPISTSSNTSPWLSFELASLKFTLSQLWITGGVGQDVGPYATPGQSIFSTHLFYRNASLFKLEGSPLPVIFPNLGLFFKYIHDYSIQGDWIALDLSYKIKSHWSLLLGGDLLHSNLGASPEGGAEFIADLKALDRIRIGVFYGF